MIIIMNKWKKWIWLQICANCFGWKYCLCEWFSLFSHDIHLWTLWKKVKTFGSHSTLVLCEIGHRKADWLIGLELFAWGLSPRYLAGLLSTSNLYYHRNWPIGLRVQSYMYQIHETVLYSYISIPIPAFFLLYGPIKIGFGTERNKLSHTGRRGWQKYPKKSRSLELS